jgi:nicotinate phosphoribosyltransferase
MAEMKEPSSGLVPELRLGIATDLYQLTMANGYCALGKEDERATFDLFVRKLPSSRSYLVVAGLEQALHYLLNVRFTEEDINFLKRKSVFRKAGKAFWDRLRNFKFTGDAWAMPEGTIAFGGEPLLTIEAPLLEAQLTETYLLTCYNHQTKIASKAARCVEAAKGRPIIEFGMRRTDIGAALRAARAAYVGGAAGSSNVMAEALFGIPSYGTHAHSWVMSFDTEEEAFKAYFQVYGKETVALVDTYDTARGAERAARLPGPIKGIRLDSGDLLSLSNEARAILDAAGKKEGKIFATNDLNEYRITELLAGGAEIDVFGVGTELALSADAPSLGGVYKLAELVRNGKRCPKLKLSKDKATSPGRKQVYRAYEAGMMDCDMVALRGECDDRATPPSSINSRQAFIPLLVPVIRKGKLVYSLPSLSDIRERAIKGREALPERFRRNEADPSYYISMSPGLHKLTEETIKGMGGGRK